jgi:hypothetical protein
MKPTQKHFAARGDDGIKRIWYTEQLWRHASALPTREVPLASIAALDLNTWFFGVEPTCRLVTEHARRINEASFEYPIILSAEGWVMDGMHRICKALLAGVDTINAVQFASNPPPDESHADQPAQALD